MQHLPAEIYNYILQYFNNKELCNYALICKAWLPFVQIRLYSTVRLSRFSQLEQFHRTVKQNSTVGSKVRSLTLSNIVNNRSRSAHLLKERAIRILKPLLPCLPNLEILQDQDSMIHTPLKRALLDFQLKALRRVEPPISGKAGIAELVDYISCALLIKDRLENLEITNSVNWLSHDELYRRLGEFSRLKELGLERKSSEKILLLEDIVKTCPSLESIQITFAEGSNSSSVSVDEIRNYVPAANIKRLSLYSKEAYNEEFFAYVTHKFPRLVSLRITCEKRTPEGINQQVVERFLHYLSGMNDFGSPFFNMDHGLMRGTISRFWAATSAPGEKCVEFSFSKYDSRDGFQVEVDSASISYSLSNAEQKHLEFLKDNGKFLQHVKYDFELRNHRNETERYLSTGAYLAHIFAYCPNIQYSRLSNCILNAGDALPSKKYSLDDMFITSYEIQEGAFEWLSAILSEVKQLKVGEEYGYGGSDTLVIRMPHTKVDTFFLGVLEGSLLYVKLINTSDGNSSYYTLLGEEGSEVLPSTEEEYLCADQSECAEICFASFSNVLV